MNDLGFLLDQLADTARDFYEEEIIAEARAAAEEDSDILPSREMLRVLLSRLPLPASNDEQPF